MSIENDYFREWDKVNLIDDVIRRIPKLGLDLTIKVSEHFFVTGKVLLSTILKNYYVIWDQMHQSWFIPIVFFDPFIGMKYKYMNIKELIYSGFSYNEIYLINNILREGISRDIHNSSPIFHSISRDIRNFKNSLTKKENTNNKNINPDDFLNMPLLEI